MKTLNSRALALSIFGLLTFVSNAQLALKVECYPSQATLYNGIYLEEELIEYGCVADPAFYVSVYDPAGCSFWQTNYQGANPDHAFGNYETGRMRPESYFVFRYDNVAELNGMNEMLQQIPEGFPYVIYTPGGYSYAQVNSIAPELAQTLVSRWQSAFEEVMIVLFEVRGVAATNIAQTVLNGTGPHGDHIRFETTIDCTLGLDEQAAPDVAVHYAGNGTWEIASSGQLSDLAVANSAGQQIAVSQEGTKLIAANAPSQGLYIVSGTTGGKPWSKKVMVD